MMNTSKNQINQPLPAAWWADMLRVNKNKQYSDNEIAKFEKALNGFIESLMFQFGYVAIRVDEKVDNILLASAACAFIDVEGAFSRAEMVLKYDGNMLEYSTTTL